LRKIGPNSPSFSYVVLFRSWKLFESCSAVSGICLLCRSEQLEQRHQCVDECVLFLKELDIRDLKKAMKAKSDELSEMQIRKDKAEKRLNDAVRDGELVSLLRVVAVCRISGNRKTKIFKFVNIPIS